MKRRLSHLARSGRVWLKMIMMAKMVAVVVMVVDVRVRVVVCERQDWLFIHKKHDIERVGPDESNYLAHAFCSAFIQ